MLKKAENNNLSVSDTLFQEVLALIKSDLLPKLKSIEKDIDKSLENLVRNLDANNMLISKGIFLNDKLMGGLIFCKSKNEILYLAGVSLDFPRKNGAMYLCMNEIIQDIKPNEILNFGGSEIENIRRFYLNLGGVDRYYYETSWNNAPFWFKIIRYLSKKIRK